MLRERCKNHFNSYHRTVTALSFLKLCRLIPSAEGVVDKGGNNAILTSRTPVYSPTVGLQQLSGDFVTETPLGENFTFGLFYKNEK